MKIYDQTSDTWADRPLKRFDQASNTWVEVPLKYYDQATNTWVGGAAPPNPDKVSTFTSTTPFYVAMGANTDWSEETFYNAWNCEQLGARAFSEGVWQTSDGVWVLSVDRSTLRVTGTDLDIPSSTWAQVQALRVKGGTQDSSSTQFWLLPDFVTYIDDLNDIYGMGVGIVEDRGNTQTAEVLAVIGASVDPTNRFLIRFHGTTGVDNAGVAAAAGYRTLGYYYAGDADNAAATAGAYDYLAVGIGATDAQIASIVALGKPVVATSVNTAAKRDRALGLGCVGISMTAIVGVIPTPS